MTDPSGAENTSDSCSSRSSVPSRPSQRTTGSTAEKSQPLCGEENCGCPTQADLAAFQRRQWHDAGRAVAAVLGVSYDESEGFHV